MKHIVNISEIKQCVNLCKICHDLGYVYQINRTRNKTTYISFKGTKYIEDWVVNMKPLLYKPINAKFKNYEIHNGFYDNYVNIQSTLHDFIQNCDYNSITFTGYSSGGVLACLFAFEYKKYTQDCITFSTPNFCNQNFSNNFNEILPQATRVIYNYDPIPFTPITYHNCGTILHFNNVDNIKYDLKDHDLDCIVSYLDKEFIDY